MDEAVLTNHTVLNNVPSDTIHGPRFWEFEFHGVGSIF